MLEAIRRDLLSTDAQLLLPPLRRAQGLHPVDVTEVAVVDDTHAIAIALLDDGREVVVPCVLDAHLWRRAEPGSRISLAVLAAPPPLVVQQFGSVDGVDDLLERSVTADMSNEVVVVGEALAAKWQFVATHDGLAGPRLAAHLAAVGFPDTPAAVAMVTWNDRLVMSIARFLPGASDGWDWMVDDVMRHAIDGTPTPEWPATVGDLIARFHMACAQPSSVIPSPVQIATDLAPLVAHYDALLDRVADLDDELRSALAPWLDRMNTAVSTIADAREITVIPVHGDLHAGQLLRWNEGVAVSDFDGNPLVAPRHRADPAPAAFDLACLLRSLDHVAQVAARRAREAAGDDAATVALQWSVHARSVVRTAYERAIDPALLDARLLEAFESLSPLHEAVYAHDYLPRWRYVPLGVLSRGW